MSSAISWNDFCYVDITTDDTTANRTDDIQQLTPYNLVVIITLFIFISIPFRSKLD